MLLVSTIWKRISDVNLLEALGDEKIFIRQDSLRKRLSTVVGNIFLEIKERDIKEISMEDFTLVIKKKIDDIDDDSLQERIVEIIKKKFKRKDLLTRGSRKFKQSIKKERSSSTISPSSLYQPMHCPLNLEQTSTAQTSMKAHSFPRTTYSLDSSRPVEMEDKLRNPPPGPLPIASFNRCDQGLISVSTSAPSAMTMPIEATATCRSSDTSTSSSLSLVSTPPSSYKSEETEYAYVALETAKTLAWENRVRAFAVSQDSCKISEKNCNKPVDTRSVSVFLLEEQRPMSTPNEN